jgi:hypothetical protein
MDHKGHGRIDLPQGEGTLILQQSMPGTVMMIYRDDDKKMLVIEQISIEWEKGKPEISRSKVKYKSFTAGKIADAFNTVCAYICHS